MKPRKLWSQLAKATRQRKLRYYAKKGLTPGQVSRRYNAGTLGPQKAVRGHKATPEHGLTQAIKQPGKFGKYLEKRNQVRKDSGESPYDIAIRFNDALDRALASMRRLRDYYKYNDRTVLANVYGGITAESGLVPGMSYAQAVWTARADIEEIRSMASEQYTGNPWWYH